MIYKFKTDLMRELVRLVAHGYQHWTAGTVEAKKLEALQLKFADRYGVTATNQQRYRRKAKGEANSHLLMWPDESGAVCWWLIATDGEGLVHQLEQLQDCREKRTRIEVTGYELLKVPKKLTEKERALEKQGKSIKKTAHWTWRMSRENEDAWKERLRSAVRRKNDDLVRQALFSLKRVPGFSESRKQAFALESFAKAEWKRFQRSDWPYEALYVGWLGQYQKPTLLAPETLKKPKSPLRGKVASSDDPPLVATAIEASAQIDAPKPAEAPVSVNGNADQTQT